MPEKETLDAAKRDLAGQITLDGLRRVCSGRDRACSRRQVWGAVGKAGDCDRAEQGTTCRDSTGSAEPEDHERGDAQKGGPGFAARRRGSCDKRGRFDEAGTNSTKSDEEGADDVSLARSPIKTG